MRTLLSTLLVGVGLLASPALAQQHPWVPSGVTGPVGSLPNGDPPGAYHPWVPSAVYAATPANSDLLPARADSRIGSRHYGRSQRNTGN